VEKMPLAIASMASEREKDLRRDFMTLFKNCPIPEGELFFNLGLFLNRQSLSRIIFMHQLYQKILSVHGVVMEFGSRWGQNLALFSSFRGMYEPYNYSRKIIGFDTFEGFPSVTDKDRRSDHVDTGGYSVTPGYETYLRAVLDYHEQESPIGHMKKYELVKGDASTKLREYLDGHRETVIAFAYFDFDIYEPTKECLRIICDYLTRGAVVAFDEVNHPLFPGETIALQEAVGISNCRLMRSPLNPTIAYFLVE
jgi:hypothetical protein